MDTMTDVTRRGFLKAIGAVAAGSLIIPAFSLITPAEPMPSGMEWIGSARELLQYDINKDSYFARIDIATDLEQIGFDFELPIGNRSIEQLQSDLLRARELGAMRLKSYADWRGIKLTNLRRLPIPDGYTPPAWFEQMSSASVRL